MGDIRTVTIGDYSPFRAELVSIERNAVKLTKGEHGWRDDGYVHWRAGDEMIVRFKALPGEWPDLERAVKGE